MPTFTDIVTSMVTYLQTIGSKLSDFTPTSVLGQILQAIASVIDEIYTAISNAQQQAFISTATGSNLDAKGADYGVLRKQAVAAQWYFTFNKNVVSTQNITIPAGTIITTVPTPGNDAITFATNSDSYLPAGTQTVSILATCQTAGSIGNIAPNTLILIGSAVSGIDGVTLPNLTNGIYGADVEADSDYSARILSALSSKAQGTVAWYQQTALSVTGVQSALVASQNRGPGTVDIYIVASGNSIPSSSLITSVQSVIDAGRIITDDAKVVSPTAVNVNRTITCKVASGNDLTATQTAVQNAIISYINGLGINGGPTGTLYNSKILSIALGVSGVINATSTDLDITFSGFQLPVAGTISVSTTY